MLGLASEGRSFQSTTATTGAQGLALRPVALGLNLRCIPSLLLITFEPTDGLALDPAMGGFPRQLPAHRCSYPRP